MTKPGERKKIKDYPYYRDGFYWKNKKEWRENRGKERKKIIEEKKKLGLCKLS